MDYISTNKAFWNHSANINLASDFYDQDSFMGGRNSLNTIELDLLGDVKGKRILHLQCHFGQDTLSLARMGAEVTGVDLSNKAIDIARETAKKLDLSATFICCDLYSLPEHLDEQFDIVFTSYGTIGWLPDLQKWSSVASRYMKPGGNFVMAEFHPVLWMLNDREYNQFEYSYFNKKVIVEEITGNYAQPDDEKVNKIISWNHPLSDVLSALLEQDLQLTHFQEFDYSPYDIFHGHGEEIADGKYRIKHLSDKMPLVYAIRAVR